MSTIESTLAEYVPERLDWDGVFEIVECRRALSPSGVDGMDYALNPYGGCAHGCVYCYAPLHTHSDPSTWRVVRVRRNIVERLRRELPGTEGTIGIGTVTDPYQYAEGRFLLTRGCLEAIRRAGRRTRIITKSDLVVRDIDILADMDAEVGITITTVDDRISKITEPGAPLPGKRLEALSELMGSGIRALPLISPVMSTLEGSEQDLADALGSIGVKEAAISPLSLRSVDSDRLARMRIRPSREAESVLSQSLESAGIRIIEYRGIHRFA